MSIFGGCLGCGGGGVKMVTFPEGWKAKGDISDATAAAAAPP